MILEKTLRVLVISAIFLLTLIPFIVSQTLFFPFITGKNFTFRIVVEIMAGGWITLALLNPAYRPRRSWILAAFTAFVLLIGLADALGAYPLKSFWSNYERMDGWVTLAHLFVYFLVASSMLSTEKLWRTFWHVSLAVSFVVAVYGFLQLFGIASLNAGFSSIERLDATFGNPIYLAAYMLFHIFIAAHLWVRAWRESSPGSRGAFSFFYGAIITIDTLVLLLTGTRGTMLGLIGGSALASLLIGLFARDAGYVRRAAIGFLVAIAVLGGGFLLVRDAAWVQQVGFLRRLATISVTDSTTKARFYNWGMAWAGVKERPILGWGQENYAIVFDKYYDPRMYSAEPWFDRVHNIVFDWLVAGGIVGLLAYLSLFATALYALWRSPAFSVAEGSVLTGLLAGYFFHNLFVFDNITSYVLFATVLGYIAWRSSVADAAPVLWKGALPRNTAPFVAGAAALLVWGAAYFINAAALAQNKLLIQAIVPQATGVAKNLELMKSAIAKGSFGTQEAREQLIQIASRIASVPEVDIAQKQAFYDAAVSEMRLQQEASPLNARFPLFLGITYNAFGNYAAGAQALERAHELSPQKQSILFEIAQNSEARGDVSAALKALETAYNLEPANVQARILYAAATIRAGKDALADDLLAPILATGEAADPRITSAYLSGKRYDKIAVVWEAHVKAKPNDAQGYFILAVAYYGMGNRAKAVSVLEAASTLSLDVARQAAALIEQIRNGTVPL